VASTLQQSPHTRPTDAPFAGAYTGRRVLVTGHTGFKGSWLVTWLHALGADVHAFALPSATAPSHWGLVGPGLEAAGVRTAHVDLRDAAAVDAAIRETAPEIVFHLAAQALVRPGFADPISTFDVNVAGLVHVLEAVRRTPSVRAFVSVTSDKCYAPGDGRPLTEDAPLGGVDPYSASKSCAELVTACWRASFLAAPRDGRTPVAVASARAGNVIGGGDWSLDRIVPDIVCAAEAGQPVRIRNPQAIRPWQHVLEPLAGYLDLGRRLLGRDGDAWADAWNFGPAPEGHLTVAELVDGFTRHDARVRMVHDDAPSPPETGILRLSYERAATRLGWRPVWDAAETIARTAAWYAAFREGGPVRTHDDIAAYMSQAVALDVPWAVGH
jgi:CDP-glucose 4,6-dehydratase